MRYKTFSYLIVIMCLLPGCFADTKLPVAIATHGSLFTHRGIINNSALQQILTLTHTPHENTLESINQAVQGKRDDYAGWMRKGERWETEDKYEQRRNELLPAFEQLGYTQSIYPSKQSYDYVIVLGSLAENVRKRLAFLLEEWKRGLRAEHIILLGSARPLNNNLENAELLLHDKRILPFRATWHFNGVLPTTEYEMMKFIVDQADIPEEIRARIVILDTPMREQDGKQIRPTTIDTINTWLSTHPTGGNVLAISHQPYVHYQHGVIRGALPAAFTVETVGATAKANERMALYLDSLAREIYQEYQDR